VPALVGEPWSRSGLGWLSDVAERHGERTAMAEEDRRLQRDGVPPELAGPRAYRDLRLTSLTNWRLSKPSMA
jgi:hypothetical protein